MLHARENCSRKLDEIGCQQNLKNKILNEIYGCEIVENGQRKRKTGLVDSESPEEFQEKK